MTRKAVQQNRPVFILAMMLWGMASATFGRNFEIGIRTGELATLMLKNTAGVLFLLLIYSLMHLALPPGKRPPSKALAVIFLTLGLLGALTARIQQQPFDWTAEELFNPEE